MARCGGPALGALGAIKDGRRAVATMLRSQIRVALRVEALTAPSPSAERARKPPYRGNDPRPMSRKRRNGLLDYVVVALVAVSFVVLVMRFIPEHLGMATFVAIALTMFLASSKRGR